jgi:hypothetical protein
MKDFIIFFKGQEGSSAIISYLKCVEHINIIGFEPFDCHHMDRPLIGPDLTKIFRLIFDKNIKNYNTNIQELYSKYTKTPINNINKTKSIGFKMRPRNLPDIIDTLRDNNIVVFVLIRKDIARHALSMCNSNHLQFQLIAKQIQKNPQHQIDIKKLSENIARCIHIQKEKTNLINNLKRHNITVHKIFYEDFCTNKQLFFKNLLAKLDITLTTQELNTLVNTDIKFQKVHDDDISKFVINYQEVLACLKKHNLNL